MFVRWLKSFSKPASCGTLCALMAIEKVPSATTIDHKPHAAFFRQSGWLMIANIIAGAMAFGVHFLSKKIPGTEYSIFGTMLMVTACIPTIPLQMLFAQQTAEALATGRQRQLSGIIRLGARATFLFWALATAIVLWFQVPIIAQWGLTSPFTLYVTMAATLMNLWMPMFAGVLQGRQDFFWFGWGNIANGFGRIGFALVAVLLFYLGATGMILGAFAGLGAWAVVAFWRSRDLWSTKPEPYDRRGLLKHAAPLLMGFAACQFLFTTDTMYAKAFFPGDQMASYVAAGTLSRALLWLVLPLAAVMFPKIVHATAKSEKSNLLGIVLLGTAVLSICGSAGLCLIGPFVVKLAFKPEFVASTTALLPWYAGAMIPLTLANVLVNDLMAKGRFKIVLPTVVLAGTYAFSLPWVLHRFPGRMEVVLQTVGAFSLVLLAICAWFSFGGPKSNVQSST
jgi:O-antigen/teichoic acid export membrane protein